MPPAALVQRSASREDEVAHAQALPGPRLRRCSNTGYKGRVGLYEVLEIDDELREMILSGGSAFELQKRAIENGMITLRRSRPD